MATAANFPENAEQAFIDQVISKHSGRPGELLGILEAVQERHPHKYLPLETLRYIAEQARHSAVAGLQRGDVLRLIQPGAPGRQHRLHLPGNGLPHPQFAQPAGELCAWNLGWAWTSGRRRRGRQAYPDHARPEIHGAHGGLLRAVRAGSGGGDQPSHLRARERTDSAARSAVAGTGE